MDEYIDKHTSLKLESIMDELIRSVKINSGATILELVIIEDLHNESREYVNSH